MDIFNKLYQSRVKPFAAELILLSLSSLLCVLSICLVLNTHPAVYGPDNVPEQASQSAAMDLTVDIEGAVRHPGVLKLPPESRLKDALEAAGGLSPDADRMSFYTQFNLASKLADEQKIYILSTASAVPGLLPAAPALTEITGLISINNADETQLDTLAGIGAITASKIVSLRPYTYLEDLVKKGAVSQGVFDKIKDRISL